MTSFDFTIVAPPETFTFNNASVQFGAPYMENGEKKVPITVCRLVEITPNDVLYRTTRFSAPATVLAVLSFDPNEGRLVPNIAQLNQLLQLNGVNAVVQ